MTATFPVNENLVLELKSVDPSIVIALLTQIGGEVGLSINQIFSNPDSLLEVGEENQVLLELNGRLMDYAFGWGVKNNYPENLDSLFDSILKIPKHHTEIRRAYWIKQTLDVPQQAELLAAILNLLQQKAETHINGTSPKAKKNKVRKPKPIRK